MDNQLEDQILIEIAKRFPYSLEDVRVAYNILKSFDATVKLCQSACDLGMSSLLPVIGLVQNGLAGPVNAPDFPNFVRPTYKPGPAETK